MIKKIKSIKNLAVFKNFLWDSSVIGKDNKPCEFKTINIFYGRNYSGKTTLSRIFRAMETESLSDKYDNPEFCVSLKDKDDITQNNLQNHSQTIRVFNEDFVKDNLKFIGDPDKDIEPFAILGTDNNVVEKEIQVLQAELGSNEEEKETRLYADFKNISIECKTASKEYEEAKGALERQLAIKATDEKRGIRYNFNKFGDQNYNIQKIKNEIQLVLKDNFEVITNEEQTELDRLLVEKSLDNIPPPLEMKLQFSFLSGQVKKLVEKKISASNKIEELVKDALLSKWVKDGVSIHKDKRETCAFCDNKIIENRWSKLEKHFDEESAKLEQEINNLINNITQEENKITNGLTINNREFYSKFNSGLDSLSEEYSIVSKEYNTNLDKLNEQLNTRKNNLTQVQIFDLPKNDCTQKLIDICNKFEKICTESNAFTASLTTKQNKAKEFLRLREVYDFIKTIKYSDEIQKIKSLKEIESNINLEKSNLDAKIKEKIEAINTKKRLLKDESKGADKVNGYLNNFFGHRFLSLKAIEFHDEDDEAKKFKFEIIRDNKKAYHLSEGENNLIAFCYFMAKLEDVETKGTKPIIWIDDPVSSLDGNHIFFVYSLINEKYIDNNFEQLFISTHSLEFLKYLKKLERKENKKGYFIVNRSEENSSITPMPEYLKEYITEFNYLFEQIYNCSLIGEVNDDNHSYFYNFGNNARKFLEIFLYYKYPDNTKSIEKMTKFFGGQSIPAILTDRINHEYSHLSASLERGSNPIEVPEMKEAARQILERIEKIDKEQYNALLTSIGENTNT